MVNGTRMVNGTLGATLSALGAQGTATLWAAVMLRGRVCVYHHAGAAGPLLALVRCVLARL